MDSDQPAFRRSHFDSGSSFIRSLIQKTTFDPAAANSYGTRPLGTVNKGMRRVLDLLRLEAIIRKGVHGWMQALALEDMRRCYATEFEAILTDLNGDPGLRKVQFQGLFVKGKKFPLPCLTQKPREWVPGNEPLNSEKVERVRREWIEAGGLPDA